MGRSQEGKAWTCDDSEEEEEDRERKRGREVKVLGLGLGLKRRLENGSGASVREVVLFFV